MLWLWYNIEMDEMQNPQINIPRPDTPPLKQRSYLALVLVLSFIFGLGGGYVGGFYALKNGGNLQLPGLNRQISLTEDSAIIDVVKKASPAVVSIVISKDLSKIPGYGLSPFEDDPFFDFFYGRQNQTSEPNVQEVGAGSGFFVSSDGLILTNKHVVSDESASYTVLTKDGTKYEAKVMATDPVNDIAIVKIEIQNAPFLTLADSSKIQIGQRVIAIGNSLGQYQNTVTSGIISGIGRKITAGSEAGEAESLSGVLQTDAAINPGNSGGPLLNTAAQVIGINTAIDQEGQLVGFALPSNDAVKDLDSFNKNGKITRPFLGVRYIILNPDIAEAQNSPRDYGALIIRGNTSADVAIVSGSPADKAGLRENDIILEIDGQKVDEDHALADLLKEKNIGDRVKLKIYSQGEEKTVEVTLEESK